MTFSINNSTAEQTLTVTVLAFIDKEQGISRHLHIIDMSNCRQCFTYNIKFYWSRS